MDHVELFINKHIFRISILMLLSYGGNRHNQLFQRFSYFALFVDRFSLEPIAIVETKYNKGRLTRAGQCACTRHRGELLTREFNVIYKLQEQLTVRRNGYA